MTVVSIVSVSHIFKEKLTASGKWNVKAKC